MAANKEGSNQGFLRRQDHICKDYCFPVAQVTFFCFVCDDEIFKSQVARHGRRQNPETREWEAWYLCRTCHKLRIEQAQASRAERGIVEGDPGDWIRTGTGLIKMGPQGVPSARTLDQRKKLGKFF